MHLKNKNWFSLIELLVVITILAIISVVAYTNFSWSTDKAKNSKRLSDLSSIETWLQSFFQEKNFYPMPSTYDATKNVWWYNSAQAAQLNSTFYWSKQWTEFDWTTLVWTWWWAVYMSWTTGAANQIWAKWTIDKDVLSKQYLSQELLDPGLKDIKVWNAKTLKDYWVWEYIYWVYSKQWNTDWSSASQKWSAYNLAITLKDDQKWYLSKVVGNFDKSTCINCPDSLIWSGTSNKNIVNDEASSTWAANDPNERMPYPIAWY